MRTTISIDDALLEHLKERAVQAGTTVSKLIEDSIRLASALAPDANAEAPQAADLVTFGKGTGFTSHDVDRTSALLALDDLDRYQQGR